VPLTLVATAGASDANSYALVSDADTAAGYRMSGPAVGWANLDASKKIQALVTASADVDTNDFDSTPLTDEQAMEFPRVAWPTIPKGIRNATIELAFVHAAKAAADATADVLNPAGNGNIKEDTVGPITTIYFEPSSGDVLDRYPTIVQRLIRPFLRSEVAATWGTGIAVRSS